MRKLVAPFLLLLLVLLIFHSWFTAGLLSSYDFPFYSQLMMKGANYRLYAWDWHLGFDGFAGFFSPYSWVFPFIYGPQAAFGKYLGMDWAFIQRIVYLYPLLILLIFSPAYLIKSMDSRLRGNDKESRMIFYLISVLVFSFNTYSLLLAGGEIFVALAYSLIPLIFAMVIKIAENRQQIAGSIEQEAYSRQNNFLFSVICYLLAIKHSVLLGLVLAIQIMMDPRVTYVTMFAVGLYLLFNIGLQMADNGVRIKSPMRNSKLINWRILYSLVLPLGIAALLHAFWIIPTVLYGKNPVTALGSAYSTTEAVKYLSFAKLEQSISLLQQNWPENIFGKVDFMKPEFLLLPILAYTSLLFIKYSRVKDNNSLKNYSSSEAKRSREAEMVDSSRQARTIIFFVLLGLIGSFLAKGTNDPFGGVYLWMFNHIPGFIMFRDPAKWYPLVALSYSILIPFTVWKIFELLKTKSQLKLRKYLPVSFLILTTCYLILLIYPALSRQLGGMFKTTSVPQDYVKLEKFLYNQPGFFRTLWLPSKQHFGYYSNTHPEISARALFDVYDDDKLFEKFSDMGVEKLLQEASIKYVIVPYDSEKEIFITDRKYDNTGYLRTISRLQEIKWLKQAEGFGKIAVFEIKNPKDHFWSPSENIKISYNFVNPTRYLVSVNNAKREDRLVFDEAFDSKWAVKALGPEGRVLSPITYPLSPNINVNSFVLPKNGDYSLEVYYKPQDWVDLGTRISLITLSLTILALVILSIRKL